MERSMTTSGSCRSPSTISSEREPREGQPPTEKTEVRILYTRTAVYFGIAAYASRPTEIVATELRRDVSQDLDDRFEIMIDPNHDRRTPTSSKSIL
jgi:hypothetical protein